MKCNGILITILLAVLGWKEVSVRQTCVKCEWWLSEHLRQFRVSHGMLWVVQEEQHLYGHLTLTCLQRDSGIYTRGGDDIQWFICVPSYGFVNKNFGNAKIRGCNCRVYLGISGSSRRQVLSLPVFSNSQLLLSNCRFRMLKVESVLWDVGSELAPRPGLFLDKWPVSSGWADVLSRSVLLSFIFYGIQYLNWQYAKVERVESWSNCYLLGH